MLNWLGFGKQVKPAIVAYGKVPALAEYVRVGPHNPGTVGFEEWLHRTVQWATERRGEDWSKGYDQFDAERFLYRCADGSVLVGVIRPSRDSVSGRFPLVCYGQISAKAFSDKFHLAPLVFDSFWGQLELQLAAAQKAKTSADFAETISRLRPPEVILKPQLAEYSNWLMRTGVRELFPKIYPEEPLESIRRALHTIVDACAAYREDKAFSSPLSVRVPHCSDGGKSLGFWIDVVRHAEDRRSQAIGWFGTGNQALIQLGEQASSSVLSDVWMPSPQSAYARDLLEPTELDGASFVSPMPSELVEALEGPSCSLARVVEEIGGARARRGNRSTLG